MDVTGAYPTVVIPKLIHDMCKHGVPSEYMYWIQRKLIGRRTTLKFGDFESKSFAIDYGIDQGCPLSHLLYQFYNADLVGSKN